MKVQSNAIAQVIFFNESQRCSTGNIQQGAISGSQLIYFGIKSGVGGEMNTYESQENSDLDSMPAFSGHLLSLFVNLTPQFFWECSGTNTSSELW